jgi:amicyanin
MLSLVRARLRGGLIGGVVALVLALVLAGCGGATDTGGTTTEPTATTAPTAAPTVAPTPTSSGPSAAVSIGGSGTFSFSPSTLTVKVGTNVTWTNSSAAPHTVTSDAGAPASFDGSLDPNGTFSFTFTKAGTYAYHCNIHPYMKATVVVK